jgi:hypothetical protein
MRRSNLPLYFAEKLHKKLEIASGFALAMTESNGHYFFKIQ